MQKPCPSEQELSGFVFGTLSENEADHVSDHLFECPACEDTVQEIERTADAVVKGLRQQEPPDLFLKESGCGRVIELVEAIGRDPSFTNIATAPVASAAPELGTIRSYRLLEKLGQGGMGSVYKALHVDLDKIVALKVLPKECTQDEAAIARFRREMKAVGKLSHQHIVQATDAGQEDGTHYLVMELVDGSDLSKLVARRGPLPVADACELIRQAAEGLEHAHKHGLVHRDIKPSNLMLTTGGIVKILDLGLALLGGVHHEGGGELTSTGQIMGTIDYMAPEQGSDTHNVDIRADVYSLGATLFKLLTGKAPFEAEQYKTPMKKLMALANTEPSRADALRPDVPKALADLVQRMLSKTPANRPTPPSEVARLLAPFAKGANLTVLLATSTPDVAVPPTEDKPVVGGSTAAAATILVDTDVSGTLEAVPNPTVTRSVSEGDGSEEPQTKPTASVGMSASPAAPPHPRPLSRGERGEGKGTTPFGTRLQQHWSDLRSRPRLLLGLGGGLIALLMGVTIFKFVTRDGTVVIELPAGVSNAEVLVDGEQAEITIDGRTVTLFVDPGSHNLVVRTPDGTELTTDNNTFHLAAGGMQRVTASLVVPENSRPAGDGQTQLELASTQPGAADANYALRFDGVDDWVSIPTLRYGGNHPLTIEATLTPADPPSLPQQAITFANFVVELSGQMRVVAYGPGGAPPIMSQLNPLDPGKATRLAVVYDGSTVRVFLDGREQQVEFLNSTDGSPHAGPIVVADRWPEANLSIGAMPAPLQGTMNRFAFHGVIDEIRISNTARYTEDFPPAARLDDDEHTLALYHFDEGQGDVLVDSSGNGHDGAIVGATWVRENSSNSWTPYVFDANRLALQFSEFPDYVELPLEYDGLTPITIEFWYSATAEEVMRTRIQPFCTVGPLEIGSNLDEEYIYARINDDRNLRVRLAGDSLPYNFRRAHIALQWSQAELTLFVDGRRATNGRTIRGLPEVVAELFREIGPQRIFLGTRSSQSQAQFYGRIDELRISDVTRYEVDFIPADRFVSDENTLALYHFDEGQGDTLRDSSGNGHDGTIRGATWVREVAPGTWAPHITVQQNLALQFDGVDDFVATTAICPAEGPVTIEAWIRWSPEGSQYCEVVHALDDAGGFGFSIGDVRGTGMRDGPADQWTSVFATAPIPSHEWIHLASVVDGERIEFFVNGRSAGRERLSDPHRPTTPFAIGRDNRIARNHFHGLIDEVRVSTSARYTEDFTPERRFETDEHTLALYHFDEGQGETLVDSSGNQHHGTIAGAAWVRETAPGTRAPYDIHRQVAEAVWSVGGRVHVFVEGGEENIGPDDPAPTERFVIHHINLERDLAITPALVQLMSRLPGPVNLSLESNPNVTTELLRSLVDAELHGLNLAKTPLDDEGFREVARCESLEALQLHDARIGDESFQHVAQLKNLRNLALSSTLVSDAGFAAISGLTRLEGLVAANIPITDAAIQHLSDLRNLQRLVLYLTDITDASIPILIELNKLKYLEIENTNITEAGVARLREALPQCTIVSDFGTFGPVQHPDHDAIAWAFSIGATVQRFNEHGSQIPVASPEEISADTAWSINLSETPNWTSADLARLSNCRRLLGVNLLLTPVTDEGLAHLAALDQLQYLHLEWCDDITDAGIAQLYGLRELVQLSLQHTAASADAIAWAARNPNLQGFYIGPTDVDDLSPLASLPQLAFLIIKGNSPLTLVQVEQVAEMPQLRELTLSPGVTDEGLEHLAKLTQLDHLFLIGSNISGEGLSHLDGLERLHALSLKDNSHPELRLEDLPAFSALTYLDLTNSAIADDDLDEVVRLPILDGLLLAGTPITNAGVERLRNHPKLVVLDLRECAVTDDCIDALCTIPNLRDLWVENTQLTEEGVARLHTTLRGCRIQWNNRFIEPVAEEEQRDFALQFDGVDDFVALPRMLDDVSAFTIEAAAMLPELQLDGRGVVAAGPIALVANGPEQGSNWVAAFSSASDRWVGVGGAVPQIASVPTHLALVFDGAAIEVFVNGDGAGRLELSETTEPADSLLARIRAGDLSIGRQFVGANQVFWDGVIDEVRISSVARYTSDFAPHARFYPDEHTLALYHFDEGDGETLIDSSGNGRHGTIAGATWVPSPYQIDDAYERETAEWVLSIGGGLQWHIADNPWGNVGGLSAGSDEPLPDQPFTVRNVILYDNPRITNDDLARLPRLSELRELQLSGSAIDDRAAEHIADCRHLESLSLSGPGVTAASAEQVSRLRLSHLQMMNVGLTQTGLDQISGIESLRHLNLALNDLSALDLRVLSRIEGPLALGIHNSSMTDDDLPELLDLRNVHYVNLGSTGLTDAGLPTLGRLTWLEDLRINHNANITDAGVAILSTLTNLTRLSVQGTSITAEGVAALHAALPGCRIEWDGGVIEPVEVSADRRAAEWIIGRRGNVLVRSREQEHFCQTLDELPDAPFELIECSLSGWVPMDGWLPKIPPSELSCLVGCRHLNLVQLEYEIIGNEGLAYVSQIPSIERLYVGGNPGITDAGLADIAKLSDLQLLVLGGCSITDAGLEQLAPLSNLKTLYLSTLPITDAGVANLTTLTGLTTLSFQGTQVTDAGLHHLSSFPNLRTLALDDTSVTDEGIAFLSGVPHLTHLGLANTSVSDECVESLCMLRTLTHLDLRGTQIQLDGVARLRVTLPDIQFVSYDADRLLAEWTLSLGSELIVRVGDSGSDNEQTVVSVDQLPAESFVIRRLDAGSLAPVSGDELRMLSDLHDMVELDLRGIQATDDDVAALHAALPGCRIEWDGGVIEPAAEETGSVLNE